MLLSELLKGIDTKSNFNDTEITDITDNTALRGLRFCVHQGRTF